MEEKSPETKDARCGQCGTESDRVVLLPCRYEDRDDWVCVRCLPMLIHGAH